MNKISRQYWSIPGDPNPYTFHNQDEVYANDVGAILFNDFVGGLSTDGTYTIRYDFTGGSVSAIENPGNWVEWTYTRLTLPGGNVQRTMTRVNYYGPGTQPTDPVNDLGSGSGTDQVYLSPSMSVDFYCNLVEQAFSTDILEGFVPGAWQVRRRVNGPGISTDTVVCEFDLRMLVLKNLLANEASFDPRSERPFTEISVDVYAYPVSWVPNRLACYFDIGSSIGHTVASDAANHTPTSNLSGYVASFAFEWDGRNFDLPEANPGHYLAAIGCSTSTGLSVPGGSHILTGAHSKNKELEVKGCPCKCSIGPDGIPSWTISLPTLYSSACGPSCDLSLKYCGSDKDKQPSSMGFGWHGPGSAKMLTTVNQGGALVYRSEGGQYSRWLNNNGIFEPAHPDNFIKLTVTSVPEATYILKFPNLSIREFDSQGRLRKDKDRNGLALEYFYTGDLLTSLVDANGGQTFLEYANGSLQPTRIHAAGRETLLTYTPEGRLAQIVDPAGESQEFFYDSSGRLSRFVDARGQDRLIVEYDDLGRVTREVHYGQSQVETFYDAEARRRRDLSGLVANPGATIQGTYRVYPCVVKVATDLTDLNAHPRVVITHFDFLGNQVREDVLVVPKVEFVSPAVFNTTFWDYEDPAHPWLPTKLTDPNGNQTLTGYDSRGNVSLTVDAENRYTAVARWQAPGLEDLPWMILSSPVFPPTGPLRQEALFSYDSVGNLLAVYDHLSQGDAMVYNAVGQVTTIIDRDGKETLLEYDPVTLRLTSITEPGDSINEPTQVTHFEHDSFGNVTAVENHVGERTEYSYDNNNRLIEVTLPLGQVLQSVFTNGLLTEMVAPANQGSGLNQRRSRFGYDSANRLVKVEQEVAPNDFLTRVEYVYNGFSEVTEMKRPHGASSKSMLYEYDRLGRVQRIEDFLQRVTQIEHAPYCLENTVTTPRGITRTSNFDSLCRLTQVESQNEKFLFSYDERSNLISEKVGERYGAATYGLAAYARTTQYAYDSLDRVTTVKQGEDLHSYAYSPAGKMTSQTDPSGNQTTYSYFDDGRLHEVTFISSQQVSRTFTYQYHASGRLAQITYPTQSGLVLKFADELNNLGWDANGRLTDMVYENSQGELHRFHYEYDPSGNRVALHDAQQGQPLKQWAYGYDWLNRLTGVTLNGDVQRLYGYDECDNRVEILLPASQERWSIAYDIADQILSRSFGPQNGPLNLVEGYEHDADGNMVRRTGTLGQILVNYTWNDSNRLQAITWVPGSPHRRSYNARGIRVVRQNASEKMKFCTSDGLSSVDRTPSGEIAYIHGHQLLGALVNGNFHYFISDGLSTIREVVDESGSVVATFEGDEFGQVIAQSGPAELLEHTYTGALGVRNDGAVLGLHYAQQRYYDPTLGKWISADPIGFAGGLNLTGYVGQDPINNTDPSGLIGPGAAFAPWFLEQFAVIIASQGTRTTCMWAGSNALRGSVVDFLPTWLGHAAVGGATGLGLYFGSGPGGSQVSSPTGPLTLMGIPGGYPSHRSQSNGVPHRAPMNLSNSRFGHTFTSHGQNSNQGPQRASSGCPHGQWLDDQQAAELIISVGSSLSRSNPQVTVTLPPGTRARVFEPAPGGTYTVNSNPSRMTVLRGAKAGTFRTAYPRP